MRRSILNLINPRGYAQRAMAIKISNEPTKPDLLQAARAAPAPVPHEAPPSDVMWQYKNMQREMGEAYPFSWPAKPMHPLEKEKFKPHPWFVDFEKGKHGTRLFSESGPFAQNLGVNRLVVMMEDWKALGTYPYIIKFFATLREVWWLKGRKTLVGIDYYGNKYYQTSDAANTSDRFVEHASGGSAQDASEIPRPWARWLKGLTHVPPHEVAAFYNWPTLTWDPRDVNSGHFWRRPHMTNYQGPETSRYNSANPHPMNSKYEHWKYQENSRWGRSLKNVWRPQLDKGVRNSPYNFGGSCHVSQQFRDRVHAGNTSVLPTYKFDVEAML